LKTFFLHYVAQLEKTPLEDFLSSLCGTIRKDTT
jgi:hypothetical protein